MLQVSIPQARQRFKLLPPNLQDAVFDYATAETIDGIAKENHLADYKTSAFAEAVGLVLLGFLRISELPKEIHDRTAIDLRLAATLASAVENRLLAGIRGDLEKVYAPAGEEPAGPVPVVPMPASSVSEIKPAIPIPTGAPAPKPFFDLPAGPAGAPAPAGPAGKPVPSGGPLPAPMPMPAPAAPSFMQARTEVQPIAPRKDFRLELAPAPAQSKAPGPPRPAQMELGMMKAPAPQPIAAPTPETAPRVVHYTQWKTSLASPASVMGPEKGGPAPISLTNLSSGVLTPKIPDKASASPAPMPNPVPPPQKESLPDATSRPKLTAPDIRPVSAVSAGPALIAPQVPQAVPAAAPAAKSVDNLLAKLAPQQVQGGISGPARSEIPVKVVNFTATSQVPAPPSPVKPPSPPAR